MTAAQQTFDAMRYKQTTREQWETAAAAWHRWSPLLSAWLGPATELMLDMAGITAGSQVLDVAAGAGDQTRAVARRIGPHGYVLATDISPTILTFAAAMARQAGFETFTSHITRGGKTYMSDLLRESDRANGKVLHRTIANVSHCSAAEIEAMRLALRHKEDSGAAGTIRTRTS